MRGGAAEKTHDSFDNVLDAGPLILTVRSRKVYEIGTTGGRSQSKSP